MIYSGSGAPKVDQAMLNPASSYRKPQDVLDDTTLGVPQKVELLYRWAYDATELEVAEEEGMGGGEPSNLSAVIEALHRLTGGFDSEHTGPTKHASIFVR